MDKVCRLTGNTNSAKNGFSNMNVTIECENEVKDEITTAVTAAIEKKDNEHALTFMEMRGANEHKLQNILQALANLSKRVDGLAIREGNNGDGGDNKSESGGNNRDRGSGGGNHNTSGKNDNKEKNVNSGNKKVHIHKRHGIRSYVAL